MFKRQLLLFILTAFTLITNAKNSVDIKTDSLEMIVSTSVKDSNLVNNYLLLSEELFEHKINESKTFANKAHHISKQINYPIGKANALYILGSIDLQQGKLHLALNHLKQSTALFENLSNKKGLAKSHAKIGNTYAALGDMVKSIKHQQKASSFYTEIYDEIGIANCYSNLGQTHFLQKNYSTALRYYRKAKIIYQRDSAEKPIAELYNRISLVFRALKQYDKSYDYDYLALMTQEKLRDKQGIANSNYNIGKTSILQGYVGKAKGYIEYAQKTYLELEDNLGVAKCYLLLAKVNIDEKNYGIANSNLLKSVDIAKEGGALSELSEAYLLLSNINFKSENYKAAYRYLNMHTQLKDSLFSKEKTRQFSEAEVKFQSQAKDEEISIAKQHEKENNIRFIIYISISVSVFGMLAYIIILMQKKSRAIKLANENFEGANKLMHLRNKEIIDSISYAKKIQEAILTPTNYMKNIFSDHFVFYKPKDIVSGDFYWAYKDTASNKVFWATADCTGHGVPGALMSVVGTVILNEIVIVRKVHEADKILNALSKYIKRYLNKDQKDISQDGIEISLCILNHDEKTIDFSGANRNLLIVRNQELLELKGDRQPIGYDPFNRISKPFSCEQVPYQKGDVLYAFTDGYTDQIGGENNQKYRIGVLKQDLLEIQGKTLEEQKEIIERNHSNWIGNNTQLDDILIVGIKI